MFQTLEILIVNEGQYINRDGFSFTATRFSSNCDFRLYQYQCCIKNALTWWHF